MVSGAFRDLADAAHQLARDTANSCKASFRLDCDVVASVRRLFDHTLETILLPIRVFDEAVRKAVRVSPRGQDNRARDLGIDIDRLVTFALMRLRLLSLSIQEAVTRAALHQSEISELLGSGVRTLSGVVVTETETHNGGRRPLVLEFDGSLRVVYKPVCLRSAWLIAKLAASVKAEVRFPACRPVGVDFLGGHLKTGHSWTLQNRPL